MQAWFDGGKAAPGAIDPKAAAVHTFNGKGGATWRIYPPNTARDKKVPLAWSSFATPTALDDTTYGYKWAKEAVTKDGALVTLPEYYRLDEGQEGQGAVGGGEREGRAGRDRAGEGGRSRSGGRPSRSPTSRPTRRTVAGRSRGRRPGRSRRSSATAAW